MGKDLRFSRDELLDSADEVHYSGKHSKDNANLSESKRKKEKRLAHSLQNKRQHRHDAQ
ncbi:hypothetical protein [Agaribacter marinus]|uniref:Uncharacterized protein n=1 Tax=Agaribacter marinus TaxID=1431249 RepID=A0AA37T341_9ALTE|nr:hypothetical protein [Agaribacter marinus]GLR72716.1 hypothetical protein GCM10007852_36240 [Agaribacter marinus]